MSPEITEELYSSKNLSEHGLAIEAFSGNCSSYKKYDYATYSTLVANEALIPYAFMNVIAGKKWWNYNWKGLRSVIASINVSSGTDLAENIHLSLQCWDGATKRNYEATVVWELNHWSAYYGWIGIYTGGGVKWLKKVGVDTAYHYIAVIANLETLKYSSVTFDGTTIPLTDPLYIVSHPDWGSDISMWATAEVANVYPTDAYPSWKGTANFTGAAIVTVELLELVNTSLTLSLAKTEVKPGESLGFSGKLSRADGATPGAQTITVDGTSVTTDTSGNYSGSKVTPSDAGTYTWTAKFGGTTLLLPSSTQAGLNVIGAGAYPSWLPLLAPFLLGGILLYISRR